MSSQQLHSPSNVYELYEESMKVISNDKYLFFDCVQCHLKIEYRRQTLPCTAYFVMMNNVCQKFMKRFSERRKKSL